ncbi:MAG TPA: Rieske 2Fe-2S domain-containing protein [Vicinamibacterales bacterium]|nr:Rieske 2Fe-2S domain-containing protein [Vicinamibacterales bacterium]
MTSTPTGPKSRLDPEPLPRRDFLGLSSIVTAGAALLFATVGMLRLPKAAVLPVPSRKFRVTLPETLAPGVAYQPPGRNVAVVRDTDGVFAVSLICTHLGCIVKASPTGFDCPCHGSRFAPDGSVTHGPAPVALNWVEVAGAGGQYTVDESVTVAQGTRIPA